MRRSASRSSGAVALLALCLVVPSEALARESAEETIEPIVFEYAAPRECPSRDAIVRQISAYTTRWSFAEPGRRARRFVLRISRRERAYLGRFDLHEVSGETVGRDVSGESCEDVALGLAVAVALALDPHALGGGTPKEDVPAPTASAAPPSSPPPSSAEKSPPQPPPAAPPPSRPPARAAVSLGARGEINGAVSGILGVVDVYLELEWDPAIAALRWFRPVVRGGFRQSFSRSTRVGETQADIGWRAGQLELCPTRFQLPAHVSLEGCVGSNLGVLSAQARGIPGAEVARRLWFDYGALLGARWQFHPHLYAEASVGIWMPRTRDRLRVEPDGVVTLAPPIGLSSGIGIGWRF